MEKDDRRWYWSIFGFLVFILVAYMLYPFLEGLVYGVFIYYLVRPIKRRIDAKIHRNIISSLLALFILASIIVIPSLTASAYIADTAFKGLPVLIDAVKNLLPDEYETQLQEFIDNLEVINLEYMLELIQSKDLQAIIIEPLRRLTEAFLWFLFTLFIALVVSFYLLIDAERFMHWLKSIFPERDKKIVEDYFRHLDCSLDSIFVGVFLTMIITTIFALICLAFLNWAAPAELKITGAMILGLAVLCGIFNLLPGIGIKIVWVPMAVLFALQAYFTGTLISSLWFLILFSVVMSLIVDFIPDQILRPYICGSGIHTGIILLAFIFGTAVFGAKGLFLGPIILATFTEYMRVVVPAMSKK